MKIFKEDLLPNEFKRELGSQSMLVQLKFININSNRNINQDFGLCFEQKNRFYCQQFALFRERCGLGHAFAFQTHLSQHVAITCQLSTEGSTIKHERTNKGKRMLVELRGGVETWQRWLVARGASVGEHYGEVDSGWFTRSLVYGLLCCVEEQALVSHQASVSISLAPFLFVDVEHTVGKVPLLSLGLPHGGAGEVCSRAHWLIIMEPLHEDTTGIEIFHQTGEGGRFPQC